MSSRTGLTASRAAEAAESDRRLRRDSLERSLVALEHDNARLRAALGGERPARRRPDPGPIRDGEARATLDRMLLECQMLERDLTARGALQSRAERLISTVSSGGIGDHDGAVDADA